MSKSYCEGKRWVWNSVLPEIVTAYVRSRIIYNELYKILQYMCGLGLSIPIKMKKNPNQIKHQISSKNVQMSLPLPIPITVIKD